MVKQTDAKGRHSVTSLQAEEAQYTDFDLFEAVPAGSYLLRINGDSINHSTKEPLRDYLRRHPNSEVPQNRIRIEYSLHKPRSNERVSQYVGDKYRKNALFKYPAWFEVGKNNLSAGAKEQLDLGITDEPSEHTVSIDTQMKQAMQSWFNSRGFYQCFKVVVGETFKDNDFRVTRKVFHEANM